MGVLAFSNSSSLHESAQIAAFTAKRAIPVKIYRIGKTGSINKHLTEAVGFLITPDDVDREKAVTAWSYAVRYTAKGLDVPDYEAAARMLAQRHPSWQCFAGPEVDGIWYIASHAENDKPD